MERKYEKHITTVQLIFLCMLFAGLLLEASPAAKAHSRPEYLTRRSTSRTGERNQSGRWWSMPPG
jgi:hypothetical protein